MLLYRAALPLSYQILTYVARIIRRQHAAIGSLWRKPNETVALLAARAPAHDLAHPS